MFKKNYNSVNLCCIMQDGEPSPERSCCGILSVNPKDGSFIFEESIRKVRTTRNPKLFDGKHISMVRKANGQYQIHMKTMSANIDRKNYAFEVYCEIFSALNYIA